MAKRKTKRRSKRRCRTQRSTTVAGVRVKNCRRKGKKMICDLAGKKRRRSRRKSRKGKK